MLGHLPFGWNIIDKHIIAFGKIFDDIRFYRRDGATEQLIKVPLTYAPKQKLMKRADVDPDATKETAIVLPHMAFQLQPNFQYDGSRKLPPMERYVAIDDEPNKLRRQYVPVPYNLTMQLYIYVNHVQDGNKIVEQILPFFTPDWTLNLEFCDETGINFDVPINLVDVQMDDEHWGGDFKERRVLVWTLTFTIKTYFLGPVKDKPIIKFAYERFIFGEPTANSDIIANTDIAGTILVKPGMDANGAATSNASITVDANTIYATNTYGYIETFSSNTVAFY